MPFATDDYVLWDLYNPHTVSEFYSFHKLQSQDMCPVCLFAIDAQKVLAYKRHRSHSLHVIYRCPRNDCGALFVVIYSQVTQGRDTAMFEPRAVFPKAFKGEHFDCSITDMSPMFEKIYNEALQAETLGLTNVCGMGYRKSLEFLVKDYLVATKAAEEQAIKSAMLGTCIHKYVQDERIKKMAQRAAWLGNDETHYQRRWEDKDVSDLKTLIGLVLRFIESELDFRRYMDEMPNPKQ